MALPTERIWLRNPYIVSLDRADLERIYIELYVYTGELTTDKPSQPQYTLESTAFANSATGNKIAAIDISTYCKDYVEITYSGTLITNAVWVEYDLFYADVGDTSLTQSGSTVQLTGLYGAGYYEDEENPELSNHVLQSSNYVVVPTGDVARIPVLQDNLTGFELYQEADINTISNPSTPIDTTTGLTPTENTANVIYYASTSTGSGTPSQIIFQFDGGLPERRMRIFYIDECEHDPIKLTFVNRFGALQDFWCFGANRQSTRVESTEYKSNVLSNATYSSQEHQYKTLNKNGRGSVEVNTGWYPESSNGTIQEMLLSEQVWARIKVGYFSFNEFDNLSGGFRVVPVILRDTNVQFKTSLNDGLINYTFNLEFAADRIGTVV